MITKAVGRRRLLKLANHLEAAIKAKQYLLHMESWVGAGGECDTSAAYPVTDKRSCGTAGCAVGYCPIVFPRQARYSREGARGADRGTSHTRYVVYFKGAVNANGYPLHTMEGAAQFFGINIRDAVTLFGTRTDQCLLHENQPRAVIKRIRNFALGRALPIDKGPR